MNFVNNKCKHAIKIGLVAALLNVVCAQLAKLVPTTNIGVIDEMVLMLKSHQSEMISSTILVFIVVFAAVCITNAIGI